MVGDSHRAARVAAGAAATRLSSSATPLWSPRRVPELVVAAAAHQHVTATIGGFSAPGRCVAVDGPTGAAAPLARLAPGAPLAPASTEKLLTGAAALTVLGAGHVFTTRVETTAPVHAGVVEGDVFLVGGGDPVLATPAYRARLAANPTTAAEPTTPLDGLAGALAAAGIHRIHGAIVADDSRDDSVRYLPSLKPSERTDIGPLGALTVDSGLTPAGVPATDPAVTTAADLNTLLAAHGVTVDGGTRHAVAPAGARALASVASPRLDTIIESMLTVSNNYTAELLVRAIASAHGGIGSTPAGLRTVVATLAKLGVPTAGISLVDGSGLSPDDRVTCTALLAAVELGSRPATRALRAGLPVAGHTGTLATRFVGDPLAGRLRAKTGHIDGVVGLAGVVETPGGTVSFAFLDNGGFSVSGGEDLQDRIAHLVADYPGVPGSARLVPAPAA